MKRYERLFAAIVLGLVAPFCQAEVKVEETTVSLPTYQPGPYDKNPIFYTGRVYQGAQGRVYPYPLQDVLHDEKADKEYVALLLENEYLKMSLLPEVGGRLFSFTDKDSGFEIFYRQSRSAETRISSSTFFSPSRASMTSTDAVHGVSTSRETRAWAWPVNATGSSGVIFVFAVPTKSSAAESGDWHKVHKSKPIVHITRQCRIIHPS
jgi:hypothetical protein